MPLTYDDKEDLYIEIDRLRREVERLNLDLKDALCLRDYWKESYRNLLTYTQVLENGCKM